MTSTETSEKNGSSPSTSKESSTFLKTFLDDLVGRIMIYWSGSKLGIRNFF